MKTHNKFLYLAASLMFVMAGCESDSADQSDVPEDCTITGSCPETPVDIDPQDCENSCIEGTTVCRNSGIAKCTAQENACPDWQIELCPAGTSCDEETVTCIDGCTEEWSGTAEKKCTAEGVAQSERDNAGCTIWKTIQPCSENEYCDSATFSCKKNCEDECNAEQTQCSEDKIQTCQEVDGCMKWSAAQACEEGKTCDKASNACVDCNSCTPGDKKCQDNGISTCEMISGCAKWSTPVDCGKGNMCNATTFACEPVCSGDTCKPFSIVLLPDTQKFVVTDAIKLKESQNGLATQLKWIKDNKKAHNIQSVIFLGDITDTNHKEGWEFVDKQITKYLDPASIPYAISTGNHDYKGCTNNTSSSAEGSANTSRSQSKLNKYFGKDSAHFNGKDWFGKIYKKDNMYITFNVGNMKFLVLALEFLPRKDVICWAHDVIEQYSDHFVIIETHAYLSATARTLDTPEKGYSGRGRLIVDVQGMKGEELYNELVKRHSNVIMAVGGHSCGSVYRTRNDTTNGNSVSEILVDYQCEGYKKSTCSGGANGGNGWLRILKFDPKTYTVSSESVSSLSAKTFPNDKQHFYCSEKYDKSNALYNYQPETKPKEQTNKISPAHNYSFSCDFVTPRIDEYKDGGARYFAHRNINNTTKGEQSKPAVAMNRSTGAFVAVWEHDAEASIKSGKITANNKDILARVFYGGGCVRVDEFFVNAQGQAGHQHSPDVAMNPNGNIVMVWVDDATKNIKMRGYKLKELNRYFTVKNDSIGDLFAEAQVNTTDEVNAPAIAMAADGSFVVAYQTRAQKHEIMIRGFNADGTEQFAEKSVMDAATSIQRIAPDIAIDESGNFIVTWQDDSTLTDGSKQENIYARRFDAKGNAQGDAFIVNSKNANTRRNPAISLNESGTFYIAYEDDSDGNNVYRIKARGYASDGTPITEDTFISDTGENGQEPTLCVAPNDVAIFAWTANKSKGKAFHKDKQNNDAQKDITTVDVRRRTLTPDKTKLKNAALSDESIVNPILEGTQNQPAMACNQKGKQVYLWHTDLIDSRTYKLNTKTKLYNLDESLYDIYGRGIDGIPKPAQ